MYHTTMRFVHYVSCVLWTNSQWRCLSLIVWFTAIDYMPCLGFSSHMFFSVAGRLDRPVDKCSLTAHFLVSVVSQTLKFTATSQLDRTHAFISAFVKIIVRSLTMICLETRAFWAMANASSCELIPNSTSVPSVPWGIENSVFAGYPSGS